MLSSLGFPVTIVALSGPEGIPCPRASCHLRHRTIGYKLSLKRQLAIIVGQSAQMQGLCLVGKNHRQTSSTGLLWTTFPLWYTTFKQFKHASNPLFANESSLSPSLEDLNGKAHPLLNFCCSQRLTIDQIFTGCDAIRCAKLQNRENGLGSLTLAKKRIPIDYM